MKSLHISDSLSLPLEFITQTQAILAKRGVGKSYTASVEAEEMLKAGQQVVVIDPTGAWFGLKSSADGRREGFPIAVFGGEHGDVPLEEHAGEIIATAIVERRFSAILDLSLLRKGAVCRFMAPFLETLYRLNREAMHLIVDEADAIAPQKPFGEEARMLGAMEDVVRRGRRRGIGCTLITQRPQVLNKNVLTQCEVLCAMRLVHPKDIDAIEEWVNVHADPQQAKEMISSLPSLPIGTAWFWSPGFGDIFKCVRIRKRETFDSSATPKAGEIAATPKVLAPVDIEKLGQQIQATVQRAKDNDPAALKRKLAELERQLASRPAAAEQKTVTVEIPVVKAQELQSLHDAIIGLQRVEASVRSAVSAISDALARAQQLSGRRAAPPPPARIPPAAPVRPAPRPVSQRAIAESNGHLSGPEQRIIDSIAWLESIGVNEPEQTAVAFLAGYTIGGGAFNNPRGRLNQRGFVEYAGERIRLTEEGRRHARIPDAPLDAQELQQRILERLPGPEQKILSALLPHPRGISNEELAAAAGYEVGGGAYNNPRGRLRSLGLIEYRQGTVIPKPLLYLEGA